MKKIFFVMTLLFTGLTTVEAQVSFKPGIRGGANFAKITQTESDFKTDFYVGIFGELKLGRFYALQPEIIYSNQGGSNMTVSYYDYNQVQEIVEKKDITFSYVSIGLVNKLNLPTGINFQLGPTFDIEANTHRYSNVGVDLAFVFGMAYNLTNNLAIEARLKKGIIDVFESDYLYDNGYYEYDDYNTNFLFQIGLSYTFGLKE